MNDDLTNNFVTNNVSRGTKFRGRKQFSCRHGGRQPTAGLCYSDSKFNAADSSEESISFIADSGAAEHLINKSILLSNFQHCSNGVIRSANKSKKADL